MRHRLGALVALGALVGSARASAEPLERGALRLEWNAPGGCPNRVELVERIEALLGARIEDLRPEPIAAKGDVRQVGPSRFELTLETHQSEQRFARSMEAPSCAELSDAGALVLALAIDPTLAERQARAEVGPGTSALPAETPGAPNAEPAPPEPKPEPKKPERAAVVQTLDTADPRDEPPPAPPKSPPLPLSGVARVEGVADFGSVAAASAGLRVSGAAEIAAFRVGLGFLWLPPTRSNAEGTSTQGGYIDLLAGQLFGCQLPLRGRFELEACATVELGSIHGVGVGTDTKTEGSALWFGFGGLVTGRLPIATAFALTAGVGAVVVPQGIEFTLENVGVVHDTSPLVVRVTLGIETEF
jgi:hypothetical protein